MYTKFGSDCATGTETNQQTDRHKHRHVNLLYRCSADFTASDSHTAELQKVSEIWMLSPKIENLRSMNVENDDKENNDLFPVHVH